MLQLKQKSYGAARQTIFSLSLILSTSRAWLAHDANARYQVKTLQNGYDISNRNWLLFGFRSFSCCRYALDSVIAQFIRKYNSLEASYHIGMLPSRIARRIGF